MDYRGHFGTILPQAQSLGRAAFLRRDPESAKLALHQLEWIVGRNPFSQSTMYGEGYDFTPLYTPSSGDIVGALPVGIQTRAESDIPYWPMQSTWTYKEVWVHPVSQWIGIMHDLIRPEILQVVEGGTNKLNEQPENPIDFEVSKASSSGGAVTITVSIQGNGSHKLSVRTNNLTIKSPVKQIILKSGILMTLKWHGRIDALDEPWVAVIVPDDDIASRRELTGSAWEK